MALKFAQWTLYFTFRIYFPLLIMLSQVITVAFFFVGLGLYTLTGIDAFSWADRQFPKDYAFFIYWLVSVGAVSSTLGILSVLLGAWAKKWDIPVWRNEYFTPLFGGTESAAAAWFPKSILPF